MARFVRKNELVFSGVFTLPNDTSTVNPIQPTAVHLVLSYTNTLGQRSRTVIPMSQGVSGWVATWDTSDCKDGSVDWMVYSSGDLVAADQGSFDIYANSANTG